MVLICACGFAVLDLLYVNISYDTPAFKRYLSKTRGDGGISLGRICFVDSLEKYTGKPLEEIRKDQGWDGEPDAYNVGGPCIVGAINAAQLVNTSGTKVRYYGALTGDINGKRMMEIIKKTPLDATHLKVYENGSTPFAVCLSDPTFNNGAGERSFVGNIGMFKTLPVKKIVDDTFFEGDVLFFSATALAPKIHASLTSLLRRGKQLGKLNVVATVYDHISESANPGKPWPMGEDSDESFKNTDLLMVDWDEAMGISGKRDINDAIKFFQERGVRALTVTHGSEPLYAYSDGTVFKKMPVRTFPICEAVTKDLQTNPDKRGDTTGCGDNFAGGVLVAMAEALEKRVPVGQLDLVEAIAWGCASGGFTCFIVGGTYLEKQPGEKRKKIDHYRRKYLEQLRSSKI